MGKSSWRQKNTSPFFRVAKKIVIIFLVFAMLGIAFSLAIDIFLRPIFIAQAEVKAIQKATMAINEAVFEHAKSLKYTEMIHYQTNLQGDIILMQPDLQRVNEFITQVNLTLQTKLTQLTEDEISIPIAQAMGLHLLAGLGPQLRVKMIPGGMVRPPRIEDSFESAGINQTRHKIYMVVVAEIQLVVPFVHKRIQLESRVPVTEVTIMGKVPDIYVGVDGGLLGDVLKNKK